MVELVWLIPAFPLLGFLVLLVAGRKLGEPGAGIFATLMMGGSFLSAVAVFAGLVDRNESDRFYELTLLEWIPSGDFSVDVGFLADPLAITMTLFILVDFVLVHR